jgi:hypothetical protein
VNEDETKRIIKAEAAHEGNVIAGAIIGLAVCILISGVCLSAAWIIVSSR